MAAGRVVDAQRVKRSTGEDDDIFQGICHRLNSLIGPGRDKKTAALEEEVE